MSTKKAKSGTGATFTPNPRRKRPGRHAKKKRPVNQTFFPKG